MKKILKGILALTMMCSLAACGSSSSKDSSDEKTVYTVATSPDYAPYESLNTDDEMEGFDIDMVALFNEYGEEDNVSFEFKQMDFDSIVTSVNGGSVDFGISGFTYSSDRDVQWSVAYLGTNQVALTLSDSDIKSKDDLKDKKLGAQLGATGETVAKDLSSKVTSDKSVVSLVTYLQAGQVDALVIDSGVAENYAKDDSFKVLDEVLLEEKNYIIAKKGETEKMDLINKYLKKFMESDDYSTLCEKYGLTSTEYEENDLNK